MAFLIHAGDCGFEESQCDLIEDLQSYFKWTRKRANDTLVSSLIGHDHTFLTSKGNNDILLEPLYS